MIDYFIYNQLQVNPFILQDQPFPGFEVKTWDNLSFITGSLKPIEFNGIKHDFYIEYGNELIPGQIWETEDRIACRKLEDAFGLSTGHVELIDVRVTILIDNTIEHLNTITFALKSLDFDEIT